MIIIVIIIIIVVVVVVIIIIIIIIPVFIVRFLNFQIAGSSLIARHSLRNAVFPEVTLIPNSSSRSNYCFPYFRFIFLPFQAACFSRCLSPWCPLGRLAPSYRRASAPLDWSTGSTALAFRLPCCPCYFRLPPSLPM